MPLYRATALIAVMLIVLLSAGYAAGEDQAADQEDRKSTRLNSSH